MRAVPLFVAAFLALGAAACTTDGQTTTQPTVTPATTAPTGPAGSTAATLADSAGPAVQ